LLVCVCLCARYTFSHVQSYTPDQMFPHTYKQSPDNYTHADTPTSRHTRRANGDVNKACSEARPLIQEAKISAIILSIRSICCEEVFADTCVHAFQNSFDAQKPHYKDARTRTLRSFLWLPVCLAAAGVCMFIKWQAHCLRETMHSWHMLTIQRRQVNTARTLYLGEFCATVFAAWISRHRDRLYLKNFVRVLDDTWRRVRCDEAVRHWAYHGHVMAKMKAMLQAYNVALFAWVSLC